MPLIPGVLPASVAGPDAGGGSAGVAGPDVGAGRAGYGIDVRKRDSNEWQAKHVDRDNSAPAMMYSVSESSMSLDEETNDVVGDEQVSLVAQLREQHDVTVAKLRKFFGDSIQCQTDVIERLLVHHLQSGSGFPSEPLPRHAEVRERPGSSQAWHTEPSRSGRAEDQPSPDRTSHVAAPVVEKAPAQDLDGDRIVSLPMLRDRAPSDDSIKKITDADTQSEAYSSQGSGYMRRHNSALKDKDSRGCSDKDDGGVKFKGVQFHANAKPAARKVRLGAEIENVSVSSSDDESCSGSQACSSESTLRPRRFSQQEKMARAKSMAIGEVPVLLSDLEDDQPTLPKFIQSLKFEAIAALLLFSNMGFIGLQVEYKLVEGTEKAPASYQTVNAFYCLLFMCELALRAWASGLTGYFCKGDYAWAWFDLIVVLMQVMETTLLLVSIGFEGEGEDMVGFAFVGRIVRVARIARIIRIVRVMRFLRAFKVLITAIYGTMKSCAWALLLLSIIMYVFAVIFAQGVADHTMKSSNNDEVLIYYFGTMPRCIFTLFKSIIGGVDWEEVAKPLSDVGWVFVLLFVIYVAFVQLVVMNVVAGLFLQSAIEQAQQDEEHIIQLRLAEKQHFVERLQALFQELDSSQDGSITLNEFEAHLRDEHMQAFLQTFEIENADAWTLFKLLDTDGGGSVDYNEFVEGCIRLKGSAKSIQMAQMMYHHKWIMDKVCDVYELVKKQSGNPDDDMKRRASRYHA